MKRNFLVWILAAISLMYLIDANALAGRTSSSYRPSSSSYGRSAMSSSKSSWKVSPAKSSWSGTSSPSKSISSNNPSTKGSIYATRTDKIGSLTSSLRNKGATGNNVGALYKTWASPPKPVVRDVSDIAKVFTPNRRKDIRKQYYGGYTPTYGKNYSTNVVHHSN